MILLNITMYQVCTNLENIILYAWDIKLIILYFASAEGFLSFKPSIPKNLLLDGEHTIESHFTLLNYQVCDFAVFRHVVLCHHTILLMHAHF